MLTYHEGALSGFAAYAATSRRGRRITVSVETSTAMCTSPRLPPRDRRHLDHRPDVPAVDAVPPVGAHHCAALRALPSFPLQSDKAVKSKLLNACLLYTSDAADE